MRLSFVFLLNSSSDVNTTPQLSSVNDADPGMVFKLDYDEASGRYRLKPQGVWLHGTAAAWTTESAEPSDELTLSPLG